VSNGEDELAFQLKVAKIDFWRQVRPNPERKWTCDFVVDSDSGRYWVEVEGGAFSGGHKRGTAADTDCEKFNWMAMNDKRVLRFTTSMVSDGRALATIEEALGV
jgi:very-short-patch-repair endonuclease